MEFEPIPKVRSEFDAAVLAQGGMNEIETFFGLIETTADALRVVELCRQGKLGRVSRRLHDKERKLIRSGSVFVFDELESGIKRWTDGRVWSPSRILGNFLIYRELERKPVGDQPNTDISVDDNFDLEMMGELGGSSASFAQQVRDLDDPELAGLLPWLSEPVLRESEPTSNDDEQLEVLKSKKLLSNHKGKFIFKSSGLIKKTISIRIGDHPHHLVCYYSKKDFCQGHLGRSSFNQDLMTELRKVKIPSELLSQQSFRKPSGLMMDAPVDKQHHAPEKPVTSARKKPAVSKRRSSFPGAVANRTRKASLTEYVPIAPLDQYHEISEIFPMTPSVPEQSIGNLEMIASIYNQESSSSQNGSRDDIFLSGVLPYSNDLPSALDTFNCQSEPFPDPSNAMKWNSWFNSPGMISMKNELMDANNGRGSPMMYESTNGNLPDPVMPNVRPQSTFFDISKSPF